MPDPEYISFTRLRELKQHAEMVVAAIAGGSFTGSDLWRIYVGLEVNSLLANHWYEKFNELEERIKNGEENQVTDIGTESQRNSK